MIKLHFHSKGLIAALSMLLVVGCGDTGGVVVKQFGAISFSVDSLGKEVADDIYQSCLRTFEIESNIKEKVERGNRFLPQRPEGDIVPRGSSSSPVTNSPGSNEVEFPRRRSEPVKVSSEIPFPTAQELGRSEIVLGERRSAPVNTEIVIEQDNPSSSTNNSSEVSANNTRRIAFAPLRRWERCKNAELQSQITRSGFSTLSGYGQFVFFLVTGDVVGVNNPANRADIPNNAGQTLVVASPSQAQAQQTMSGFLGIEKLAQSMISLVSNLWLAQVRANELRPLMVCRNEDIQTLASTLNRLSSVFYLEFVLRNEEELKKDYFELSYRQLQESLVRRSATQVIFDDSVESLTAEFDQTMQNFKTRKEKVDRLAAILDNLAFYHNEAAISLSSGLTTQEVTTFCNEYDTTRRIAQGETSQPSAPLKALEKPSHLSKTQIFPNPSHPLLAELTPDEKRELASLLSDFVKSLK